MRRGGFWNGLMSSRLGGGLDSDLDVQLLGFEHQCIRDFAAQPKTKFLNFRRAKKKMIFELNFDENNEFRLDF